MLAQLARARTLRLQAHWRNADGSRGGGTGHGIVRVHRDDSGAVILSEEGRWRPVPGSTVVFRAGYRWKARNDRLSVEHVRYGIQRPVFLLDLVASTPHAWSSLSPHVCGEDQYDAGLSFRSGAVVVSWRASGPRKHYSLTFAYEPAGSSSPGHRAPAAWRPD